MDMKVSTACVVVNEEETSQLSGVDTDGQIQQFGHEKREEGNVDDEKGCHETDDSNQHSTLQRINEGVNDVYIAEQLEARNTPLFKDQVTNNSYQQSKYDGDIRPGFDNKPIRIHNPNENIHIISAYNVPNDVVEQNNNITNTLSTLSVADDTVIDIPMMIIDAEPVQTMFLVQANNVTAGRNDRSTKDKICFRIGICFLFGSIAVLSIVAIVLSVLYCSDGKCLTSKLPTTDTKTESNISFTPKDVFNSTIELQDAVDNFLFNISLDDLYNKYGTIEEWDVSRIEDFSYLFASHRAAPALYFNKNISNWDVSSARIMDGMFIQAIAFNQNLCKWNVSRVESFDSMFYDAQSFPGDISCWDVKRVQNATSMFRGASEFSSDLSQWDVRSLINVDSMFNGATSFQSDLSTWDVSNVLSMIEMFRETDKFNSNLSMWNVSKVTRLDGFASMATAFDSDVSNWDTSRVERIDYAFANALSFRGIGIGNWNVSKVQFVTLAFYGAKSFDANLSKWDTSNVQEMSFMFAQATSFRGIGLKRWNFSAVTHTNSMFHLATSFDCNVSKWDVSNLVVASSMFRGTQKFGGIGLDNWKISKTTSINSMFSESNVNRSYLNSWNVQDINILFDESAIEEPPCCLR
jgi:surface protein